MQIILVILSTTLQLFYLLALLHFGIGIFNAVEAISTADPKLVAGALSASIVKSLIAVVPSILGLLLSLNLLRSIEALPNWFKRYTRLMSYLWLLFIPIGTVIGVIQLKRLRHAT
ncbi:hypothetical protein [Alishewanella sp. SMS8]|uniref:hypothetical protein n=1 Tax=Alishewanella sp. SMS8 TaxID=2994676 RepID=UPI0027421FCF|nr:hypothetical protein [Alishewanella sp. SMS8]MDP5460486.1 hypothetical protein [Alishewanella sp. SMS8]